MKILFKSRSQTWLLLCIISLNIMAKAAVVAPLANFPPPISSTVPPNIADAAIFTASLAVDIFSLCKAPLLKADTAPIYSPCNTFPPCTASNVPCVSVCFRRAFIKFLLVETWFRQLLAAPQKPPQNVAMAICPMLAPLSSAPVSAPAAPPAAPAAMAMPMEVPVPSVTAPTTMPTAEATTRCRICRCA